MSDEVIRFSDVINNTFKNISVGDIKKANSINNAWEKVILKIKSNSNPNEGQKIYEHTRIVDLKNGVLLVEADHPGWITLLQMHKKFILTGLGMQVPELKIDTLAIKLKGKKGEIYGTENVSDLRNNTRNQLQQRALREQKELEEAEKTLENGRKSEKKAENNELPPELSAIFADLKKSMEESESLT